MRVRRVSAGIALGVVGWAGAAQADPAVRFDARVFTIEQQDLTPVTVPAVETLSDGATFYDFRSGSAHTGFEQPRESLIFLHRDVREGQGALSLMIIHGADDVPQPVYEVNFGIRGVPDGAVVTLSDGSTNRVENWHPGGDEFFMVDLAIPAHQDRGFADGDVVGIWYVPDNADNSDGGVLSDLTTDVSWEMRITPEFIRGLDAWAYFFADGADIPLNMDQDLIIRHEAIALPDTVVTDEGTALTLCAFARDPDHAALAWRMVWNDPLLPAVVSMGETARDAVFCATHTYRTDGDHAVQAEVRNPDGAVGLGLLTARVRNVPPVPTLPARYAADQGEAVPLVVAVADPGADAHTARWDFDGDGQWDTAFGPLAVEYAWPRAVVGEVVVEVDDGADRAQTRAVVEIANLPPVFTSAPGEAATVGEAYGYNATARDPGADLLVFALVDGPPGLRVTVDGAVRWIPGAEQVGAHPVTISVSDGEARVEQAWVITVVAADEDGDGIVDETDNCAAIANPDQQDLDGDGLGDACDDDLDGDGVINAVDNCVFQPNPDQADGDGDGAGDACDPDIDGDGVAEADDNCPAIPNVDQADLDNDGIGDACDADLDNDTHLNPDDNCPATPNLDQVDLDGDGVGDVCDVDRDGDGVEDGADNCPDDANPDQADLDADGLGDVCDPETDGDGVPTGSDNCPDVANPDQADQDGDGLGDACDADLDGDGAPNDTDNCPAVGNRDQGDVDGDGAGDACDPMDDRPADAGVEPDAMPDAAPADALPDAAPPVDAALPDAALPDATLPDAEPDDTPDGGVISGTIDSGTAGGGVDEGCSCRFDGRSSSEPVFGLFALLGWALRRRRR